MLTIDDTRRIVMLAAIAAQERGDDPTPILAALKDEGEIESLAADLDDRATEAKSGIFTDKAGRRYKLQDGKRVPLGNDEPSAPKTPAQGRKAATGLRAAMRDRYGDDIRAAVKRPSDAVALIRDVVSQGGDVGTSWEYMHAAIINGDSELKASSRGFDTHNAQTRILDDAKTSNKGSGDKGTVGFEDSHKRRKISEWRKKGTDHIVRFTVLSPEQQGVVVAFGWRPGKTLSTAGNVIDMSSPGSVEEGLRKLDQQFREAIASGDPRNLPSVKLGNATGENTGDLLQDVGQLDQATLLHMRETNARINEVAMKYRKGMQKMNEETARQIVAAETKDGAESDPEATGTGLSQTNSEARKQIAASLSDDARRDFLLGMGFDEATVERLMAEGK